MSPEEAQDKFLQGIRRMWGEEGDPSEVTEAAHVIGDVIGLSWENSPYLSAFENAPEKRLQRVSELLRELIRRFSKEGTTIMVMDDLQWVDSSSLALLKGLLQGNGRPYSLQVLAGARPEFFQKRRSGLQAAETIALDPVSYNADLVRRAYPDLQTAPDDLLNKLIERADGNPYFLEEMVKSLLGSQEETTVDGDRSGPLNLPEQLPTTLQAMLQARLDGLPRNARDVALLASVVGRIFWFGALFVIARKPLGTGLLNLPPDMLSEVLKDALRKLVRAEFVFPRAGSTFVNEQEYIFKHNILRDTAYQMVPLKYHKEYHLAVARWLEQRAGTDMYAVVGEHFEDAERHADAVRCYRKAMHYAESRGAVEEAEWLSAHIRSLEPEHSKEERRKPNDP